MSIEDALREWSKIPDVVVLGEKDASLRFGLNTIGAQRRIKGALSAQSVSQVQEIVAIANTYIAPLYPISGGHNWGYGSSLPAVNDCVILDLSQMRRIVELNKELACVTVEPGVTQRQLYEYIQKHNLDFMVPTSGAGPNGSLIGNALEKGYGITPYEDHFGAILNLKAVLPDGEIYHSAISEFGGHRSDAIFKWKLGPYLEGLFAQGNMGIVVQATIALAPKPQDVTQFLMFVDDKHFEDAVTAVGAIKQRFGSMLGGVNLMNRRRLLSMVESNHEWLGEETVTEVHIREMAKKHMIPDWVVMGGVYCPHEITSGITKVIKKEFGRSAKHSVFLGRRKINLAKKLLKFLPIPQIINTVKSVDQALSILEGVPSEVAIPLAYLKNHKTSPTRDNLSPDADGCGLIWYSPLIPIDASLVRDYTQEITRICLAKGIEPLITLTTISERCFDSTIPILFDLNDKDECVRAQECYRSLLDLSREMGVFPYRVDVETMRELFDSAEGKGSCFTIIQKIKDAIDPNHIISPGRYSKFVPYE